MEEAEQLLAFWFGELEAGFADDAHRKRWFSGGKPFDEACRAGYSELVVAAAAGHLDGWLDAPRSRLAFILLTDQIPRNIYRGQAQAFATDGLALNAARDGISTRMDRTLEPDERCFFYLPFEHSENAVDQHAAVGLFTELRERTAESRRQLTGGYLDYAQQHRDIILRFGRFPHRNAVLGRTTTAEEAAFLEKANSFGQAPT